MPCTTQEPTSWPRSTRSSPSSRRSEPPSPTRPSPRRSSDDLSETRKRTEELRGKAAKWNQTLTDGIADLVPDTDHDYRRRTRNLLKECDEAIDNSDPADTWTEFEPWLYNRVSHDVLENYTEMRNRAGQLSELVDEHFREASGEILDDLAVYNPVPMVGGATVEAKVDLAKMGLGATGFQLLRGSYMGVLMFSMVGSMVGIALGPIAIGIGLIMGRKSLKDERERQLNNRRLQAKNAVRKYPDEVTFVVNKDTRDTLRRVQRQLRDHYSARAEELHRSTSEALNAATTAAQRSEAERKGRLKDLAAELERLHNLRDRALALHPGCGPPDVAPRRHPSGPRVGSGAVRRHRSGGRPRPHGDTARRAASCGHCREGQGRQVHPAERARGRPAGSHRRGRVHPDRHLVPERAHVRGHDPSPQR